MSRTRRIAIGERYRHLELGDEGEITGTHLATIEIDGSPQSVWIIAIAYEVKGGHTTQRFEERLFKKTHRYVPEAKPCQT